MADRFFGGPKLSGRGRPRMLLALAGLLLSGVVAPAAFGPSAAAQEPANGCEEFDVLLLMDTSASLKTTDPTDQRIDAAQTFIDGLAQSGSSVNMTIAGFGYVVANDQKFVLPAERDAAAAYVERFRSDKGDSNTDYVNALLGAVRHFEGNALPQRCKILMWFTDGAHDIEQPRPEYVDGYTTVFGDGRRLEEDFENVVCGPMPDGYTFDRPLSEQIREFEMVVRMIDLEGVATSERQRQLRENTGRVLQRLLKDTADEDCGVVGERIRIENANALIGTFFVEAQRQVGRPEIDCAVLTGDGVPAALVESVAVLASPGATATLLIGSRPRGEPGLTVQYELAPEERLRGQYLTVAVEGGQLESCFATLGAVLEPTQATPTIFDKAPSTPVYFAVGAPDVATTPLSGVDDRWANLAATVDGGAVNVEWSPNEQQWIATIPRPEPGGDTVTLEIDGEVTVDNQRVQLEPVKLVVEVSAIPSAPPVRWSGTTFIQGTGEIDGELVVSPLDGASGQFCVTFDSASRELLDVQSGSPIGNLSIGDTDCFPADEGLRIPAPVTVDVEANTEGEFDRLGYTATYTPPDEAVPLDAGAGDVQFPVFELTKPADAGKRNLVVLLLTALSALISYAVLQAFTVWQSRLGDPRNYLVASVPAVLETSGATASLRLADTAIRIEDLHQVSGSRTEFWLTSGVRLKRRLSLNPFKGLAAQLHADTGRVIARPASGPADSGGRRYPVPLRFHHLVAVVAAGTDYRVLALVPIGSRPSDVASFIHDAFGRMGRELIGLTDGTVAQAANSAPDQLSGTAPAVSGGPSPSRASEAPQPEPPNPGPTSAPPDSGRRPPPPPRR
jgi:hypothetical protein